MDKGNSKGKWDWLPAHMPGVALLLADKRRELGDAYVKQCWEMGVNQAKLAGSSPARACWQWARSGPRRPTLPAGR